MSKPLEGLSEVSSMESSEESKKTQDLNLKATELRLGLPGSESPERELEPLVEEKNGFSVGAVKSFVSGAKRGFSVAINGGSGKWAFSGSGGSGVDLAKCGVLLSPKGFNGGAKILGPQSNSHQPAMASTREKVPQVAATAAKEQVVGWPPIRSFRKNSMVASPPKIEEDVDGKPGLSCLYVKVSMDGAPYLRKVDLKNYNCYKDLTLALQKMFSSFTIGQCGSQGIPTRDGLSKSRWLDLHGSEYALTFEDKDGDWMLVGDLPWEMFVESCKRLRIMKSSDDVGLGPRATEKCENR